MKILGNVAVFIIVYLLFMMPTYVLPYLGSNSSVLNTAGAASGAGLNPALFVHVVALVILIAITYFRGKLIGKNWLIAFPILASAFDLLPVLSLIPFVPTLMHLLAIIFGVIGANSAVATSEN